MHPHTRRPIPSLQPTNQVYEFPIGPYTRQSKGPAQIIIRLNSSGPAELLGVISHDTSRVAGDDGYDDYFQVQPNRKWDAILLDLCFLGVFHLSHSL